MFKTEKAIKLELVKMLLQAGLSPALVQDEATRVLEWILKKNKKSFISFLKNQMSTLASPSPQCLQAWYPDSNSTHLQGVSLSAGQRIGLIHLEFLRCKQLGLQAPAWLDWDFLLGHSSALPPKAMG